MKKKIFLTLTNNILVFLVSMYVYTLTHSHKAKLIIKSSFGVVLKKKLRKIQKQNKCFGK